MQCVPVFPVPLPSLVDSTSTLQLHLAFLVLIPVYLVVSPFPLLAYPSSALLVKAAPRTYLARPVHSLPAHCLMQIARFRLASPSQFSEKALVSSAFVALSSRASTRSKTQTNLKLP